MQGDKENPAKSHPETDGDHCAKPFCFPNQIEKFMHIHFLREAMKKKTKLLMFVFAIST